MPTTLGWQRRAFDQDAMVEHMNRGSNVGARLGNGWLVVDYDPRNDPTKGALVQFFSDFGLNPNEYTRVVTGSGGEHIYMRAPKEFHGRNALPEKYGKGVEFKGRGRQVVAAGSVHPNGTLYAFAAGSIPLSRTGEAPAELLKMLAPKPPSAATRGKGADGFGAFTEGQIEDALSKLDATRFGKAGDLEWFTLMCACHWASGGAAREEFIAWSLLDPAYADQSEVIRNRWDSLSHQGSGHTAKSGYLFKSLNEHGVPQQDHPRERAAVVFDDLDAADFLEDDLGEDTDEHPDVLKIMNERHAFVMLSGQPHYINRAWSSTRQAFRPNYVNHRAMRELYANKMVVVDVQVPGAATPKKIEKTWADYWMSHPQRREYDGAEFCPGGEPEMFVNGGKILNLWEGWPLDPNRRGEGDWSLFKELIRRVLAAEDPEMYEYIIRWMAYSVQNPYGPQGAALVLRGPKRIGKGLFSRVWLSMFGAAGMAAERGENIFGRFNADLETTCALFLDEAYWAGNREQEGALKARITEPTFTVEQKYLPAREVPNHLKIVMATNEQWVVPATADDSRYCVADCQMVWPEKDPFFSRVAAEMYDNGGLQAMFYDLLNMPLGNWHPKFIVHTDALREQVRISSGPIADWWIEQLEAGVLPHAVYADPNLRDAQEEGDVVDWPNHFVAVPMLFLKDAFKAYLETVRQQGDWAYRFDVMFRPEMKKLLPPEARERVQVRVPDNETYMTLPRTGRGNVLCYVLPPLGECRDYANKMFGKSAIAAMDDAEEDDLSDLYRRTSDVDDLI